MQKESVLSLLEERRGEYVSGSEIAKELCVSRNSVWKVIKALEEQGYKLKKSTRLGYMLLEDNDELTLSGIKRYLTASIQSVEMFDELESTNSYLMQKASLGAKENILAVAKSQTAGRGRKGRDFHSPSGGVYFSILLNPPKDFKGASYLTCMAAVSVKEAINEVYGIDCGIKWVNDIYIGNKKCAGILTEATIDFETGGISHAVVGVGVNVVEPKDGFPEDIKQIACAIGKSCPDGKNRLVSTIANKFMAFVESFERDSKGMIQKYQAGSILIGKQVVVKRDSGDRVATCLNITDEGYLLVEYGNGEQEQLFFGEVSLCINA